MPLFAEASFISSVSAVKKEILQLFDKMYISMVWMAFSGVRIHNKSE